MKKQEKKLLISLGNISDKYLDQARPRKRENKMPRILTVAASLVLVVGISMWVLLSGMLGQGEPSQDHLPPTVNDSMENGSTENDDFPESPDPYKSLASAMQDYLLSNYGGSAPPEGDLDGGAAPETGGGEGGSNGSYVEVTDNQVEGIIEGDLYKTTDKYIFRYRNGALYIYSIDGEDSAKISYLQIVESQNANNADMFLSEDGNTVTVIRQEYIYDGRMEDELMYYYYGHNVTKVYSVDVSDVENPVVRKTIEINGSNSATRKIGDKIYLVTSVSFRKNNINIDDPATYIPSITEEDTVRTCDFEKIYYCDEITKAAYYYVTVFNENDLSLASEYAILSEYNSNVSNVYFTDNHILFEYSGYYIFSKGDLSKGDFLLDSYSWIELIDFSDNDLRYRGSLEMRGWAESGQYSYDEKDGYLRVVVSTYSFDNNLIEKINSSLYIYDLSSMMLVASVENFAPEGERATAVRFEGDKLYVCTAETRQFIDPVFFFDLSDYSNITQVNTGYIDGFSSSLIDLGEGYLIGIGRESREQGKIEVYKREGDTVVSVAEFLFYGTPSSVYKSYLIDRENNLFGFASDNYRTTANGERTMVYVVLQLDGERLRVVEEISFAGGGSTSRAFYRDGYVYYSGSYDFKAVRVDIE